MRLLFKILLLASLIVFGLPSLAEQSPVGESASPVGESASPASESANPASESANPVEQASSQTEEQPIMQVQDKLKTQDETLPKSTLTRLPNGLTVLIKEDKRFPLASLRLYVHAGSVYENAKHAGISHLLEHMVFKGTQKFPSNSIATAIEQTGGYLNAATSFDYTMYLTDMTSQHWAQGLQVLKDMAFAPTLDPEALASEKEVVISELKRGQDTPDSLLFELTQKSALAGTPYATPIIGFEDTIRGISSQDMHNYMGALYHPHSMLLLVVGDVNTAKALEEIEAVFGNLPIMDKTQQNVSATLPLLPTALQAEVLQTPQIKTGPWNKVYLSVAIPVAGYGDLQSTQLDVLANLLASDATSRFYQIFKYDKRLVDSISMNNVTFEQIGLLYLNVLLDADKLKDFWLALSQEIANLSSVSFTDQELQRVKLNLEDSLFLSKETLAGYASKLGYFQFFGRGEVDEGNYLASLQQIEQDHLSKLIASTFVPERIAINALVPDSMVLENGTDGLGNWLRQTLNEAFEAAELARPKLKQEHAAPVLSTNSGKPELMDLGQNRTVILQQDHTLPYVSVSLRFLGGDQLLVPKQAGLAQFTASLLEKGTTTMSAKEFQAFQSDRAAALKPAVGKLSFGLNLHSPAKYLDDMLGLMLQSIHSSAFLEEEGARVKETQIAAITLREDQPTGLAFRRLFPFLFGEHNYGLPTLGYKETLSEFTALDAKSLWNRQQQYPWILSVAGSFDPAVILEFANKLPIPKASPPPFTKANWNKEKELLIHLKDRQQAHLMLVFPTAGVEHSDRAGLNLLQTILAGQSGLLFEELRDKQGLGYTVTAIAWENKESGFITFYIGTSPEQIEQAHKGFLSVIQSLKDAPLSDMQVERGKNQIIGDFYRAKQTLKNRSDEVANLLTLGLPITANEELMSHTAKLTASDLQALAKKYLNPKTAYTIKVLP